MVCSKCKKDKNLDCFAKDKYAKTGYNLRCKKCISIYNPQRLKRLQNLLESNNYRCSMCSDQLNLESLHVYSRHHKNSLCICEKCYKNKACNCLTGKESFLKFIKHPFANNKRDGIYQCVCGTKTKAPVFKVINGQITSCGCRRYDKVRKHKGESAFNWVYRSYKYSAKKDKKTFLLSKDQVKHITTSNCYYCNSKPSKICGSNNFRTVYGDYVYNGIDRIDSNKGYEIENCVPCCEICNRMKWILSKKDFLNHISTIFQHSIAKGAL